MTAPEGQPPPPTHIAGYRVERVLAVTAMATVYLVHSPTLPRREVLKVLQPERANGDQVRAQFLHEADITAGLEHPNIVRVFSRGETDTGQLWIAMEYVEGEPITTASCPAWRHSSTAHTASTSGVSPLMLSGSGSAPAARIKSTADG